MRPQARLAVGGAVEHISIIAGSAIVTIAIPRSYYGDITYIIRDGFPGSVSILESKGQWPRLLLIVL